MYALRGNVVRREHGGGLCDKYEYESESQLVKIAEAFVEYKGAAEILAELQQAGM